MRRLVVAVALGLGLAALSGATATASRPIPVVHPGQAVAVSARGFAAGTPVTVQLVHSVVGRRTVHADRHGRVRLGYPAPRQAGTYTILLAGRSASTPVRTPIQLPSGPGDQQVLTVVVPLVASVPFRVITLPPRGGRGPSQPFGGHGTDGLGLSGGQGIDGANLGRPAGGDPGLAASGTDLRTPLLTGVALLLLGLVTTAAARRRARP